MNAVVKRQVKYENSCRPWLKNVACLSSSFIENKKHEKTTASQYFYDVLTHINVVIKFW